MFVGCWQLRANRIIWHYERTAPLLLAAIMVHRDEPVSPDRYRLILGNGRSGRRHAFVRVK